MEDEVGRSCRRSSLVVEWTRDVLELGGTLLCRDRGCEEAEAREPRGRGAGGPRSSPGRKAPSADQEAGSSVEGAAAVRCVGDWATGQKGRSRARSRSSPGARARFRVG
jgi:hypothetical protein